MGTMYRIDGDLLDDIADAINTAKARPNTVTVENLSVTENDTYTAPSGKAYGQVTVNVPTGATIIPKTGTGSNPWFVGYTDAQARDAVLSGAATIYVDYTFNLGGDDFVIRAYGYKNVDSANVVSLSYNSTNWVVASTLSIRLNRFSTTISAKYFGETVVPTDAQYYLIPFPTT